MPKFKAALRHKVQSMAKSVHSASNFDDIVAALEKETDTLSILNEKVPTHEFIIDEIIYEWYDGHYYKKVGESKTGESFGELALRVEKG